MLPATDGPQAPSSLAILAVGDALSRDFNFTTDGSFTVALANGTYDVKLTMGDAAAADDQMGVFLGGLQVDSVTTAKGQLATRVYTATATDGHLVIGLKDLGGFDRNVVLNALEINTHPASTNDVYVSTTAQFRQQLLPTRPPACASCCRPAYTMGITTSPMSTARPKPPS